jgi:predicted RNA-binding protein Jag
MIVMSSPKQPSLEQIKEVTLKVLSWLGFQGTVLCRDHRSQSSPHIWVEIVVPRGGDLLIGKRGTTLQALQYILGRLFRACCGVKARVVVDVNEYRLRRIRQLEALARSTARTVKATRRLVVLRPMSSYERRVIHLSLKSISGVTSESLGDEPNRRVVVKPVDPLLGEEEPQHPA